MNRLPAADLGFRCHLSDNALTFMTFIKELTLHVEGSGLLHGMLGGQFPRGTFTAHRKTPRMALEKAAAACSCPAREMGSTLTAYSTGSSSSESNRNSSPAKDMNCMPAFTTPTGQCSQSGCATYYMQQALVSASEAEGSEAALGWEQHPCT